MITRLSAHSIVAQKAFKQEIRKGFKHEAEGRGEHSQEPKVK